MAVSLALYTLMEYSFSDPEDSLLSMIRFESTGSVESGCGRGIGLVGDLDLAFDIIPYFLVDGVIVQPWKSLASASQNLVVCMYLPTFSLPVTPEANFSMASSLNSSSILAE